MDVPLLKRTLIEKGKWFGLFLGHAYDCGVGWEGDINRDGHYL